MTIPSNLISTRLSSLASTPAAAKPAAANNPGETRQPQESAAKARASLPAGLIGHNVNTTA